VWVFGGVHTPASEIIVRKAITIRSEFGPESTFIIGQNAHRVFNLGNAACTLSGVTIMGGHTGGDGGGIYCSDTTPVITNCTLSGNSANWGGGGICFGTLIHCTLSGNSASYGGGSFFGTLTHCTLSGNEASYGGGSSDGTLTHCTFSGNSANFGGGSSGSTLTHCTLSGNSAIKEGGGSYYGTLQNCIVSGNTAPTNSNWNGSTFSYSCTTPLPPGDSNISDDPKLSSDLRLLVGSPCIDTGISIPGIIDDLDGIPRPLDGNNDNITAPDMGAYEVLVPVADSDHDGLNDGDEINIHGTSPVKANTDGDPASDYEEWVADTDPFDPTDFFRITSCNGRTVWFPTSSNRVYTLYWCLDLEDPYWGATRGQSNIPGSGGIDSFTDPYDDPSCFYRIEVGMP
jgi:hypothetical protein